MRKPEGTKSSGMDSMLSGFVLDPSKYGQLSLEEKRQLVHEISQSSENAPTILSSLTRKELLEIICAEMGEERKYSGFTKFRMIDHLLKLVSPKSRFKRQRKQECQYQFPGQTDGVQREMGEKAKVLLCHNLACGAALNREDVFCRRCSCCICHQYDDNKDPSLWLICGSDSPDESKPCGLSCHLKCSLEHEQSGILKNGTYQKLDGDFYCVSCGNINGLMRTLRKQLLIAKDARRVDTLCIRISLSHKILEKTEKYKELLKIVEFAVEMLENEVGPLDQASKNMDRSIVNRLSCGTAVQKLCTSALEAFDSIITNQGFNHMKQDDPPTCRIYFEELSPTKVTVVLDFDDHLLEGCLGCKLWHRKSTSSTYPEEATYIALNPVKRFKLDGLDPSTEYFCKVSLFSKTTTLGFWEAKWATPAEYFRCKQLSQEVQEEKENAIMDSTPLHAESMSSNDNKITIGDDLAKPCSLNDIESKIDAFPVSYLSKMNNPLASPVSSAPATPCKFDGTKECQRFGGTRQVKESDYEYSVGVIRSLEHEGHIKTDFRVKFLTWFSLKATANQRRVVRVFIETFIDDHSSLAGQLMDTFMDEICGEQKVTVHHRLCTRFWH